MALIQVVVFPVKKQGNEWETNKQEIYLSIEGNLNRLGNAERYINIVVCV